MASIEQCPDTTEKRTSRSSINECPALDNYHCLKTEDGQLRELCTSPIWIEAGKCPIYSSTGKLDARICRATPSRKCPTNVYKSNLNFNYPGCLPNVRSKTPTQHINGEQTTQNSSLTLSGSGEEGSYLAVIIVVPLLVVFFVILAVAWLKRKVIRKWIRDFAQSICCTESDVEAIGTPECQATQASTVSQATDENKAEGQQSGHDHGSEKKTKENIQASDTDHQENQSLLNADDSAKDKKPKKKKSKTPEKKPEFTTGSNGKHESAEKEENIQASDKTREENQSLLNADDSATEVPNKKAKKTRNPVKHLQRILARKSSGKSKNAEGKDKIDSASNGENIDNQIVLDTDNLMKENNDKDVHFVSTQPKVTKYTDMEVSAEHFGEPQEKPSKKVSSVSTQSKDPVSADLGMSAESIGKPQEKTSKKVGSVSTQSKDPVSADMGISAENIGKPQEKTSKKVGSVSTQSKDPVSIDMGVSSESIGRNQSPETPNDRFIQAMADMVLDKDVLVLISSIAKERIDLAQFITLKTCENTMGTNMRMVHCFRDLRCLKKEKRTIVTFIHDNFNPDEPIKKSAVHDTLKIIQKAMKPKDNEVHALFSLSREEYDDFTKTLKKSSLKYAVYDLSTKQEHK